MDELISSRADVSANSLWRLPPANLKLEGGGIDVWLVRLDTGNTAELAQILSADEQAGAARFKFEPDKKRFIAARAFLRIILGKYLPIKPRQISFQYSKYGKPSIGGESASDIKFNLSHSDNLALYAVTEMGEVGVDIERIKTSFVDKEMVFQCLTRAEIEHFETLSETARDLFFFDCWTGKEAYLKALGNGLQVPPNQIEIRWTAQSSIGLFEDDTEVKRIFRTFQKLPAIPDFAAAIAFEGDFPPLRFWRQPSRESLL